MCTCLYVHKTCLLIIIIGGFAKCTNCTGMIDLHVPLSVTDWLTTTASLILSSGPIPIQFQLWEWVQFESRSYRMEERQTVCMYMYMHVGPYMYMYMTLCIILL